MITSHYSDHHKVIWIATIVIRCVHLYYTADGRQRSSFQWIRVLHMTVTDMAVPPRASVFKQGRHYVLCNTPRSDTNSCRSLSCSVCAHREDYQRDANQHHLTQHAVLSSTLAFLTKTSFPLTRNWTLNGPEMAKAFAIFRVASFT